jgi:hypothetical protein
MVLMVEVAVSGSRDSRDGGRGSGDGKPNNQESINVYQC